MMRLGLFVLWLSLISCQTVAEEITPPSPAPSPALLPAPFSAALRQVQVPPEAVGVYVQELENPTSVPMVSWQAGLALQPASTMKLVTSYAALELLGPAYTWKTSVYTTGARHEDVLEGDLILQGGGDPHLVLENFWVLLRQIRAAGIREIHGNLIIDNAWMQPRPFDAAQFDGDPTRPYNAGPDGLLINFNVLELQLHPDQNGLRAQSLMPLPMDIVSEAVIRSGPCGDWRAALHPVFSIQSGRIQLRLGGSFSSGCGDRNWMLQPYPLTNVDFDGALFRGLWSELGGQLTGAVQAGPAPESATPLTTLTSQTLPEVLREMNKYSNNVMTRLVLLTLDHEDSHLPADPDRAVQLVQRWLTRLQIPTTGFQMENGSGLSRSARISAEQMGAVLSHAFDSPLMPEYLTSLPIAGVDGTMQKRVAGLPVAGYARIKTGGLEGVRNIAGYVRAASGKQYVVVCFVNHPNARQTEAAQDLLLQWVYEHG